VPDQTDKGPAAKIEHPFFRFAAGQDRSPHLSNPIAGPIRLEGTERGDILAVMVENILSASSIM